MKKTNFLNVILSTLLLFLCGFFLAGHSSAQDDTDVEATQEAQIQENIRQRIDQAIQRNQVGANEQRDVKAYVGSVESITDQSLSLLVTDVPSFINVDDLTLIVDEDDEELELTDLEIGSSLIAVGFYDENEIFNAAQLISLADTPERSEKQTMLGRIVDINSQLRQIEVLSLTDQNTMILTLLRSVIMTEIEDETATLNLADMSELDEVMVVLTPTIDSNNLSLLKRVAEASPTADFLEDLEEADTNQ